MVKRATKTCNLFCNIAVKRVEIMRRCAFYQSPSNMSCNKSGLLQVAKSCCRKQRVAAIFLNFMTQYLCSFVLFIYCYLFIIVSLSIQRIVQSVIQPFSCNGFLIKLSIYLSIYLSTFCIKICTCCVFYQPKANLFCSK